MAQINNPNWIISLYVTYISLTPFAKASGTYKEARPRFKGDSRSALAAASLGLFYHNPHNLTRLKSLRPALTRPEEEGIIKAQKGTPPQGLDLSAPVWFF